MKGVRALASGMLVLVLSCAIPAISAAQDSGTTTDATTTTGTTTEPTNPVASPAPPDVPSEGPSAGAPRRTPSQPSEVGSDGSRGVPAAAPSAVAPDASSPKARKSASASVTMGDLFFSPESVSIAVGDTVTWRNNGQAPHNATADDGSFKTPDLNQGQSASETFNQAGTFSYICTIHPNMKGTVRVLASNGGGSGGDGASSSGSSGSSNSEASAVASPGAAGNANTLPMTGMAVGGLALVGFALLALGLIARLADRERSRGRWLSIF
jgi:plastocyanin